MHRTIPLILYLIFLAVPAKGNAAIRTVDDKVVVDGAADYNRADADAEASTQHDERASTSAPRSRSRRPRAVADDSTGALDRARNG